MSIIDRLELKSEIYVVAMSHSSYSNENDTVSYERLEFLGDAVLDYLVSAYLYNEENIDEGEMTKSRAHYVCEDALNIYSLELRLDKNLLLGTGEEDSGGREKKTILADIFESFLGALYLDKGLNFVSDFFDEYVLPIMLSDKLDILKDYKTELQEYVQTSKKSLQYKIVNETGPAHDKEFTINVMIDNMNYGTGTASNKKTAEQFAAREAIKKCVKER